MEPWVRASIEIDPLVGDRDRSYDERRTRDFERFEEEARDFAPGNTTSISCDRWWLKGGKIDWEIGLDIKIQELDSASIPLENVFESKLKKWEFSTRNEYELDSYYQTISGIQNFIETVYRKFLIVEYLECFLCRILRQNVSGQKFRIND